MEAQLKSYTVAQIETVLNRAHELAVPASGSMPSAKADNTQGQISTFRRLISDLALMPSLARTIAHVLPSGPFSACASIFHRALNTPKISAYSNLLEASQIFMQLQTRIEKVTVVAQPPPSAMLIEDSAGSSSRGTDSLHASGKSIRITRAELDQRTNQQATLDARQLIGSIRTLSKLLPGPTGHGISGYRMNSPVYKTINSAALYLEETLGPKLGPSCSGRPKKLLALLNLTLPQLNEAITRHYRTAILNGGIPDIGISHFVRLVKRAESAHLTSTREHALSLQQASSAPSACVSHAGSADQATADVRSAPPLPRPVPVRLNGALPCPPSAPIPVGQRDGQWASPDHGGWVFRNSGPHPECRHPYPAKPIRGGNAVPVPCSSNMQRQQQEPPLQQAMRRAAAQRAAFKELTERLRKSNPDKRPGLFIKGKWCPLALATRRVRQRGQAFDQQRPVSTQVGTLTVNAKSDSSVSSAAEKGQSPDGFIA